MKNNFKIRSNQPEIMDDMSISGSELLEALDRIAWINRRLGGNAVTINGLKKCLAASSRSSPATIVDLGCGNGDMLRAVQRWAKRKQIPAKLIGIDANFATIQHAKNLSDGQIDYIHADFLNELPTCEVQIYLCTLTLHHFTDQEIEKLLRKLHEHATIAIIVNDLHRSKLAFRLFSILASVLSLNKMSTTDGLTSILRGFRRKDFESYCAAIGLVKFRIKWMWAFRYQWIIFKS